MLDFFTGTFSSPYYLGTMLNSAGILMIGGCGAIFALLAGKMNLGGEGQIYTGGFITALLLNILPHSSPILTVTSLILAFLAAAISTAFLALISGLLYQKNKIPELLTTFLISAAIIPMIDAAITVYFKSDGNLIALPFIPENERLPKLLPPSSFNVSFFIAILLSIAIYLFFSYSFTGQKIKIWGKSNEFAAYCGYSPLKANLGIIAVSGAIHGIVGFVCVCGSYYTCHEGFYSGMGWNALSCALIARRNPILIIPSSLFLAWLYTSADRTALLHNFNFDISGIIQGLILFLIAIPIVIKSNKKEGIKK